MYRKKEKKKKLQSTNCKQKNVLKLKTNMSLKVVENKRVER